MRSTLVYKNVWVGPGDDIEKLCQALNKFGEDNGLKSHEIGILCVADDYKEGFHDREVMYIHAGLNDGPEDWSKPYGDDNSVEAYQNAELALDFLARNKKAVYVFCHGGVSRSPFVVALYMWCKDGGEFGDALARLKKAYPSANPHPKHVTMIPKLEVLRNVNYKSSLDTVNK